MLSVRNIAMTVCALLPIHNGVPSGDAQGSPKLSGFDDVAATEDQVVTYCFTNNQTWRHETCTEIVAMLRTQFSSDEYVAEAGLLLAKAYEGLKTYATDLAEQEQWKKQEREVIESLLAKGVRTPEVLYQYARALSPEESVPVFEELLAKVPRHVNGLTLLAFDLQRLGGQANNIEAAQLLQRAYENDSGSMKYYSAMKAYGALHAAGLGREAIEFRQRVSRELRIDAAVTEVNSRLSKNGNLYSVLEAAKNLADKACIQAYLALEDFDPCLLAIRQLQKLHQRRPDDARILRILIGAVTSLSTTDSSYQDILKDYYERYLQLEPDDVEGRFEYAQLLPTEEQFELLKRIVREYPEAPAYVHFALAKHLEYNGDEDGAIAELTKAFDLVGPDLKYSYGHDLLRLLQNQNKHEEAEILRDRMRDIG